LQYPGKTGLNAPKYARISKSGARPRSHLKGSPYSSALLNKFFKQRTKSAITSVADGLISILDCQKLI